MTVFEAGPKALAKVAITGGGRCNLTNDFQGIRSLAEAYPRGERVMKRALKAFSQEDTIRWFTAEGVPCTLQADHCWFPESQDAMDIVRCLLKGMKGADLRLNTPVTSTVVAGLTASENLTHADAAAKGTEVCSASAKKYADATEKTPFPQQTADATEKPRQATLLRIMSTLDDTCVVKRVGPERAEVVKGEAASLLENLSEEKLKDLCARYAAEGISPGGAADMLALTIFIDSIIL